MTWVYVQRTGSLYGPDGGKRGAGYSGQGAGPWGYTVDPHKRVLSDRWSPTAGSGYDQSVYGPNGFFRRIAGGLCRRLVEQEPACFAGDVGARSSL